MVAGATGIDVFLLVIDAGEGPRAQTYEHLAILRLLGVDHGVVAVTKADAVSPERLEQALAEARELVPAAPVVAVSARTGAGLDELRAALAGVAAERAASDAPPRLPVDRSFSLPGIGTVVTGTLWSGTVGVGDALRVEPSGLDVRVRSVEVHDRAVDRAEAGGRVAVALPGVDRRQVRRGDVLVAPGAYPVSYRLDVELDELEPLEDGAHVQAHHGTAEVPARVVRVGDRFAQLRLERPVVAARGDHVILRAGHTVGGGRVLDPAPPRRTDAQRMGLLAAGDPGAIARAAAAEPLRRADLARRGLLFGPELDEGLAALDRAGDWFFTAQWLETRRAAVSGRLAVRAASTPLDPGVPTAVLFAGAPWASAVLERLGVEQREGKAYARAAPALGERARRRRRCPPSWRPPVGGEGRGPRAGGVPRARGRANPPRRRLCGVGRCLRRRAGGRGRGVRAARGDPARVVPGRARDLAPVSLAPARAHGRGRDHPPRG